MRNISTDAIKNELTTLSLSRNDWSFITRRKKMFAFHSIGIFLIHAIVQLKRKVTKMIVYDMFDEDFACIHLNIRY